MGILDLPAPAFTWLDNRLSQVLPPTATIVVWGIVCALASMELYRWLSPQTRIADMKHSLARSQRELNAFDGEFSEAWPLIRRMLSLALRRIGLVLPATIAASLPVLFLVVWLDNTYGGAFPSKGTPVRVEVSGDFHADWIDGTDGRTPGADVTDAAGQNVATVPLSRPVLEIHKWQWWNAIIGNPAGYLADSLPFDRIRFALPRDEILPAGPSWLRGWEPLFFAVVLLSASLFKFARRIE